MAIPESFIDELVARSEITDVVSSYVRLTRKGSNYWGLCPFHNEKTPSFSVSQEKQIYHCFGCGKGGGVISFIMATKAFTFSEFNSESRNLACSMRNLMFASCFSAMMRW